MDTLQYLLGETERSYKTLLERAKKVPADKLDWKPMDSGRSVLDICQECAHCLLWPMPMVKERSFQLTPEMMEEYEKTRAQWTNLETIEEVMHKHYGILKSFVEGVDAAELDQPVTTPWSTMSVAEAIALPIWNLHYHTGQINYIQTLYGDFDM